MNMSMIKKCIAEIIGTMVLVFVACGIAVCGNSTVGISLGFGLVIVAMAYSIGNISGCHINPAVSVAMAISKRITWKECGFYVISQVIGAFIGALLLGLCLRGEFSSLGGNEITSLIMKNGKCDAASYIVAFVVEVVLTFIFVITILGVTDKKYHDGKHAGIVIGLALALVHLLGLNFTGTSVNPARSLAPAILQAFNGNSTSLQQVWIWILAPLAGAALAAVVYGFLNKDTAETNSESESKEIEE